MNKKSLFGDSNVIFIAQKNKCKTKEYEKKLQANYIDKLTRFIIYTL